MDSVTDPRPEDLAFRIVSLLRAAHPLRVGVAMRRADTILTPLAPDDRAAVLDRAIHLALTADEGWATITHRR